MPSVNAYNATASVARGKFLENAGTFWTYFADHEFLGVGIASYNYAGFLGLVTLFGL